jgi:hypothetical protein
MPPAEVGTLDICKDYTSAAAGTHFDANRSGIRADRLPASA